MKYLHTMIRISSIEDSLRFYCDGLGLKEVQRQEDEEGRYTLIFLAPTGQEEVTIELTYNWDKEEYTGGRNFGHLAYRCDNIYALCEHLMTMGYTINRPPRDGHMAFVKSPDGISIELLDEGHRAPKSPWVDMENTGSW